MQEAGGQGGHRPPPPVLWTGGAQGAPRNGTGTCRSLITTLTMTILCDMNSIESSKIMLSKVRQLLHIRLPLQNEHFLPCVDNFLIAPMLLYAIPNEFFWTSYLNTSIFFCYCVIFQHHM